MSGLPVYPHLFYQVDQIIHISITLTLTLLTFAHRYILHIICYLFSTDTNRDVLKATKERLAAVDDEVTDERAELVATAGLLDQNDKLRAQIQAEEKEKIGTGYDGCIICNRI